MSTRTIRTTPDIVLTLGHWDTVYLMSINNTHRPVLTAAEAGAWDGGSVGTPCAVQMAGSSWRLYYAGRAAGTGSWEGIGLALSGEGDLFHGVPTVFKRR